MAYNPIPANANTTSGRAYDSPQIQTHEFEAGTIGAPHVTSAVLASGNGAYPIFTVPVPGVIYQTVGTVVQPGTGATSNVQFKLVSANNGVNVSSTIVFQNLITTGVNANGNVYVLEYNYNVLANGANSSSNVVAAGGFACNAGDTIIAIHTGNTLVLSTVTEWAPTGAATFHN